MTAALAYGTDAKDYLARAEDRLAEGSAEALFYSALEIRCGIESRIKQYLAAQAHISKAKKSGWKIAKLAKGIEAAFRTGDQIVEFSIMDGPKGKVLATFLYTPVTSRLQKLGQQLGNYLHVTTLPTNRDEVWWSELRAMLEESIHLLRMATTGELLGAPLLHKETNQIQMSGEFNKDDSRLHFVQGLYDSKSHVVVRVGYHKEWKLIPVSDQHTETLIGEPT
ncbi:MAG: hypothetical protein ABL891_15555 [Burkholderiales bacterium]